MERRRKHAPGTKRTSPIKPISAASLQTIVAMVCAVLALGVHGSSEFRRFSPLAFLHSGHAVGEMFGMSEISLRL